jgi:hypothetical protein
MQPAPFCSNVHDPAIAIYYGLLTTDNAALNALTTPNLKSEIRRRVECAAGYAEGVESRSPAVAEGMRGALGEPPKKIPTPTWVESIFPANRSATISGGGSLELQPVAFSKFAIRNGRCHFATPLPIQP